MAHQAKAEILGRSLVFSGLSAGEVAILAECSSERLLRADEHVFWEGDEPDCFYIVAEGRVKAVKHSSQGKELLISFFERGEMFGEVAVFEDKPYPASAVAVVESKVLGIRKDDFLSFLSDRPQVALQIIGVLAGRLRDAQGRLRDLAGERVEQRLARMLLMLSSRLGSSLPFTRQEIADMAGTSTETTIRFTSRLKDAGIIDSVRGKVLILDESRLRLLSEGRPPV